MNISDAGIFLRVHAVPVQSMAGTCSLTRHRHRCACGSLLAICYKCPLRTTNTCMPVAGGYSGSAVGAGVPGALRAACRAWLVAMPICAAHLVLVTASGKHDRGEGSEALRLYPAQQWPVANSSLPTQS
jgi:hypothetical protein